MLTRLVPYVRPQRPAAPPIEQDEPLRERHNYPGSAYLLPADQVEKQRLLWQHDILKDAFNGKVLLCPIDLSKEIFALDSGVGAGAWLLDFAKQCSPSSVLHGIDIEDRLLPQPAPLNASFSINTITELPMGWTSRFDLVHQRLLVMALKVDDWAKAISEMYRVLVPGGWVQLCEPGLWTAGPATARWQEIRDRLFEHFELSLTPHELVPALLRQSGFVDVDVTTRPLSAGEWAGKTGREVRDNFSNVYRNMKPHLLKLGCWGLVSSERELDMLFDDVAKEWDDNEGCTYEFVVVIARRPL